MQSLCTRCYTWHVSCPPASTPAQKDPFWISPSRWCWSLQILRGITVTLALSSSSEALCMSPDTVYPQPAETINELWVQKNVRNGILFRTYPRDIFHCQPGLQRRFCRRQMWWSLRMACRGKWVRYRLLSFYDCIRRAQQHFSLIALVCSRPLLTLESNCHLSLPEQNPPISPLHRRSNVLQLKALRDEWDCCHKCNTPRF